MAKKQIFKTGEKVLFGIVGVFIFLAFIGYVALETVRMKSSEPMFQVKTKYDFNSEGERGSKLFRTSGCTSCHKALRNGTNMGLSLDGVGSARSLKWIYDFLRDPEATYKAKTLDHGPAPKEAAYVAKMPEDQLHAIAVFISELKAEQGSSSAPVPPKGRSQFIDDMVKVWAPPEWKDKYKDVRTTEPSDASSPGKE
jgi:cytochrome c553